ncbi:MAG TPA: SurA N-terminal domain-containing protein, partial [Burkholderiales bacterium]|nr:SurA N-terminal domain-containing protein [Burkholderiales bacterium]
MFDLVQKHKKLIQIMLAIIFLPFAFFGIDSYFRSGDGANHVATVGGQPISQQEFSMALQERQNYLQRLIGKGVDPSLLDSPELRFAVLDGIIRQRLLVNQAVRSNVLVSDEQLQQVITEQPAFQDDGKFSHARYVELLKRQNTSEIGFEATLRRDLMLQRVNGAYLGTAIVPNSVAERLLRANAQQREVSQSVLDPDKFAAQVKVDDPTVKAYYDSHQSDFQVPEQARVEYVVLALDAIAAHTDISADEIKQFYEQNLKQYARGEERQASHILITVDAQATPEQKQAARAKAEQLLKQVKQNPASFAELAKNNSQDPGSAAKGGDLGSFPRGAMDKPFDDAVFSMKPGDISNLVESRYGYHIIKVTGEKKHSFDEARKQVELDLKRQKAGKKFADLAEQMNNQVFEHVRRHERVVADVDDFRVALVLDGVLAEHRLQQLRVIEQLVVAAAAADPAARLHRQLQRVGGRFQAVALLEHLVIQLLGQIREFLAGLLALEIELDLLARFVERVLFLAGDFDDVIAVARLDQVRNIARLHAEDRVIERLVHR